MDYVGVTTEFWDVNQQPLTNMGGNHAIR
jgi:hypothetical protein